MSSHIRKLSTLGVETLERRDLLTASAELVTDLDIVSSRNSPIEIVASGDITYQVARQKDADGDRQHTSVVRIGTDVSQLVRVEGYLSPGSRSRAVLENELYFSTSTGLWKSDGTEEGTRRLGSSTADLTEFNDRLYFTAGDQLWVTDGTETGTKSVKDLNGGSARGLVESDGNLFFTKRYLERETEIWKSDGTADGTRLVTTVPGHARIIATTESHIFLEDKDGDQPLWVTDGTSQGTHRLADTQSSGYYAVANDRLFHASGERDQVWVSDGTNNGTRLVMETRVRNPFGCGFGMFSTGDEVYFSAIDGSGNDGLWKTDGTEEGTVLVKAGKFASMFADDGVVYLAGHDEATGLELWKTDGTPEGTVQVLDLVPGPESSLNSRWTEVVANDGMLYFTADDGVHGFDLWRIPIQKPPYVDRAIGDSNNDGIFDSSDLVKVFQAGKYENDAALEATFDEGDWNGDGVFDSSDLVAAFQAGTYADQPSPDDIATAIDTVLADEDGITF